jgi:hypothetical protein
MLAAEVSKQHADEPACHEVQEGQSHRPIVAYPDPRCSADAAGFLNPTGFQVDLGHGEVGGFDPGGRGSYEQRAAAIQPTPGVRQRGRGQGVL